MSQPRWNRQPIPLVDELRELRDIARGEHGPEARSTRHIEACLEAEERAAQRPLRDVGSQDVTPSSR